MEPPPAPLLDTERKLNEYVQDLKKVQSALKDLDDVQSLNKDKKETYVALHTRLQHQRSDAIRASEKLAQIRNELMENQVQDEAGLDYMEDINDTGYSIPPSIFNQALGVVNRGLLENHDFGILPQNIRQLLRDQNAKVQAGKIAVLEGKLHTMREQNAEDRKSFDEELKSRLAGHGNNDSEVEFQRGVALDAYRALKQSKNEIDASMANLNANLTHLENEKQALIRQLASNKEEIAQTRSLVQQLDDEKANSQRLEQDIVDLRADLTEANRVLDSKRDSSQVAREERNTHQNDMRQLQKSTGTRINLWKSANKNLEDEKRSLEENVLSLESKEKQHKSKMDEKLELVTELQAKVTELGREKSEAINRHQTSQGELTKLTEEHRIMAEDVDKRKAEIVLLNKSVSDYQAHAQSSADLERDNSELREEIKTLQQQNENAGKELNETIQALRGEKTKLTDEVISLGENIKSLEQRAASFETNVRNVAEENKNLQGRLKNQEDLQGELETLRNEKTSLEEDEKVLKQQVEDRNALNAKVQRLENEQFSLQESERTLKQQVEDRNALNAEVQRLENEKFSLQESERTLKQQVEDRNALNAEVQRLESEKLSFQESEQTLRQQVEDQNKDRDALNAKVQSLESKKLLLQESEQTLREQVEDRDALDAKVQRLQSEKLLFQESEQTLKEKIRDQEALQREIQTLKGENEKIQGLNDEIQRNADSITSLNSQLVEFKKAALEMETLRQLKEQNKRDLSTSNSELEKVRKELEFAGQRIQELETSSNQLENVKGELSSLRSSLLQKDKEVKDNLSAFLACVATGGDLDIKIWQLIADDFATKQYPDVRIVECRDSWSVKPLLIDEPNNMIFDGDLQPLVHLAIQLYDQIDAGPSCCNVQKIGSLVNEIMPRISTCEEHIIAHLIVQTLRRFGTWNMEIANKTMENAYIGLAFFLLNNQLCMRFPDIWKSAKKTDKRGTFIEWTRSCNPFIGIVLDSLKDDVVLNSTSIERLQGCTLSYGSNINLISDDKMDWIIIVDRNEMLVHVIKKSLVRLNIEKTSFMTWVYTVVTPEGYGDLEFTNSSEDRIQWFRDFILPWGSKLERRDILN